MYVYISVDLSTINMLTFIELCAGVGGFRKGLERTGRFKCVWASDADPHCAPTYDAFFRGNSPSLRVEDLWETSLEDLPSADLIVAGFPCQSFSIAGHRKGFQDPRGTLFFHICDCIKAVQPKYVLLENVKNLRAHDSGKTFRTILEKLDKLGYNVYHSVLDTATHTPIPQHRERLFLFAVQKEEDRSDDFEFPAPVEDRLPLSSFLVPNDQIPARYIYTPRLKVYPVLKEAMKRVGVFYQYRRYYVRENKSLLCPTLTANGGSGGHNIPLLLMEENGEPRKLTPLECFRLQGFDDCPLPENLADCHLYHQAGNAVSVPLIERIGEAILQYIQ